MRCTASIDLATAFFGVPGAPFDFKDQHDYDLHIALEVDAETRQRLFYKDKGAEYAVHAQKQAHASPAEWQANKHTG